MNKVFAAALIATVAGASSAFAIEPIQGSITYNGQPNSRLELAPVGSSLAHEFSVGGTDYREAYVVQADRSLKLVNRTASHD